MYRFKKYTVFEKETDLCLNNLTNYPENQKITLIHYKKKYIFRISDLINIWVKSLSSNGDLYPEPRLPKNPYTNLEFNLGHLANIYLHARKLDFNIPILITLFWQNSLDMEKFRTEGYPMLKEAAVRNYMCDNSQETLFYDIINEKDVSNFDKSIIAGHYIFAHENFIKLKKKMNLNPFIKKLDKEYFKRLYFYNNT